MEAGTYWEDRSDGDLMGVVCRGEVRLFGNMTCQPLFLEWVKGWLLHGIKYVY